MNQAVSADSQVVLVDDQQSVDGNSSADAAATLSTRFTGMQLERDTKSRTHSEPKLKRRIGFKRRKVVYRRCWSTSNDNT